VLLVLVLERVVFKSWPQLFCAVRPHPDPSPACGGRLGWGR